MKPTHHVIISGIAGVSLICYLNSWVAGIACFASGVLIDLDHIIDYFAEKKKMPSSYKELSDYCAFNQKGKLFLIFHGVEYIIILFFVVFWYPNSLLWGILWGVGLHMLCDQFSNPFRPLGYFILYRMKKNFDRKDIFTEEYVHKTLQLF